MIAANNETCYRSDGAIDSDNKTRLIPFEFSTTQTYMLEFSNLKMRVYKDSGAVLEGDKTISGITAANPAVVTATSHGYENGDEVVITGVGGMTEVNGKRFLVADKTTNTFELQDKDGVDINSSSFTTYTSGGVSNKVFELTTPYTTAQLFDLKLLPNNNTIYTVKSRREKYNYIFFLRSNSHLFHLQGVASI